MQSAPISTLFTPHPISALHGPVDVSPYRPWIISGIATVIGIAIIILVRWIISKYGKKDKTQ